MAQVREVYSETGDVVILIIDELLFNILLMLVNGTMKGGVFFCFCFFKDFISYFLNGIHDNIQHTRVLILNIQ